MKTVPLILPENPSGFRSIPSTEQRLESIEKTLDMIASALRTLQKMQLVRDEAERFAKVRDNERAKDAKREEQSTNRDRIEEYTRRLREMRVDAEWVGGKASEPAEREKPRRRVGLPAKTQVESWIMKEFTSTMIFTLAAKAGIVRANVTPRRKNAPANHYYTHQLEIRALDRKRGDGRVATFRPSLFGIDEAREVVAYLESLGVNVNKSALDTQ